MHSSILAGTIQQEISPVEGARDFQVLQPYSIEFEEQFRVNEHPYSSELQVAARQL
ncbi:hypothetical protein [Synechococcus sp. PCC 7336]|uniref:hypothetical protein n=1 Tax=Synechococcus sp. PCC 7336 TaxID=195250 RepID=UPI00034B6CED|nr:hypothetical protein [Synechococcus sp. PCC 7336]